MVRTLAALVLLISPAFAEVSDDSLTLKLAARYWAGINCGNMIPLKQAFRDQQEFIALGDQAFASYLRRIRLVVDREPDLKSACRSVKQTFFPNG